MSPNVNQGSSKTLFFWLLIMMFKFIMLCDCSNNTFSCMRKIKYPGTKTQTNLSTKICYFNRLLCYNYWNINITLLFRLQFTQTCSAKHTVIKCIYMDCLFILTFSTFYAITLFFFISLLSAFLST